MVSSDRFRVVSHPIKVIKYEKLRLSRTKRPQPVRLSPFALHEPNISHEKNVQVGVNPMREF